MRFDPSRYSDLPDNPHRIKAGSLLFPTDVPIVPSGATSRQFLEEEGGSPDTFVFMLGIRPGLTLTGETVAVVVGVFLNPDGPGFEATWDLGQLMREIERGGWTVIPTADVLARWTGEVERRVNMG